MKNIGKRRRQLGLSIGALAKASGINRNLLLAFESGRTWPSRETLKQLAGPLKAEVGDFTDYCSGCDGTGYKVRPNLVWKDR